MDADNKAFQKLKNALIYTLSDFLNRGLPLRRIALVASLLKECHIKIDEKNKLTQRILNEQKSDGGWIDCEDTAWLLFLISDLSGLDVQIQKTRKWLEDEKCIENGWGFCKRDRPCIPISAQVLYFLTELFPEPESMLWVEREWKKDLNSPVNLNYKAAWYLLAYYKFHNRIHLSDKLFEATISYLITEQRSDGSWGPWRDHPAPSDCFITGICMAALAISYPLIKETKITTSLKSGIQWIKRNQLENGLFPTHYIEEGSAWLFFGWCKAMNVIGNTPS
jgi:hypothetical protein